MSWNKKNPRLLAAEARTPKQEHFHNNIFPATSSNHASTLLPNFEGHISALSKEGKRKKGTSLL